MVFQLYYFFVVNDTKTIIVFRSKGTLVGIVSIVILILNEMTICFFLILNEANESQQVFGNHWRFRRSPFVCLFCVKSAPTMANSQLKCIYVNIFALYGTVRTQNLCCTVQSLVTYYSSSLKPT